MTDVQIKKHIQQIMIAGEWRNMSEQNKAMHEALESIAQTWDGCEVDVTSVGAVDVGEALRKQFSALSQPAPEKLTSPVARLQAEVSDRPYSEGETFFQIVILDRDRCFDGMNLYAAPPSQPAQSPERYETFGYALAMRVLTSDIYPQLDDKERAECDELIARGMRPAQSPVAVPEGWRDRLQEMRDAAYTITPDDQVAHVVFDSVINALDEMEKDSAPLVSADAAPILEQEVLQLATEAGFYFMTIEQYAPSQHTVNLHYSEKCFHRFADLLVKRKSDCAASADWPRLVLSLGCMFDFDASGSVDEIAASARAAADKRIDAAQIRNAARLAALEEAAELCEMSAQCYSENRKQDGGIYDFMANAAKDCGKDILNLKSSPQVAQEDMKDAYVGAREDLAVWKRRALEAERDLRAEKETTSRLCQALNEQNGPTFMGEPVARVAQEPAQAQAQVVAAPFDCWSNDDGDSWGEHPADADFVDGLNVGDTYELLAGWTSVRATYRVTKAPDDQSDDYEVECVSHPSKFAASPVLTQPSEQPDQSGGDILKHMSRYWEHQWHDGDQYLIRISRENLEKGISALLYSSQPVVSKETKSAAVDERDKLDAIIGMKEALCSIDSLMQQTFEGSKFDEAMRRKIVSHAQSWLKHAAAINAARAEQEKK